MPMPLLAPIPEPIPEPETHVMNPTDSAASAYSDRTLRAAKSDFRFLHRLRVRWSEVDMQKGAL